MQAGTRHTSRQPTHRPPCTRHNQAPGRHAVIWHQCEAECQNRPRCFVPAPLSASPVTLGSRLGGLGSPIFYCFNYNRRFYRSRTNSRQSAASRRSPRCPNSANQCSREHSSLPLLATSRSRSRTQVEVVLRPAASKLFALRLSSLSAAGLCLSFTRSSVLNPWPPSPARLPFA